MNSEEHPVIGYITFHPCKSPKMCEDSQTSRFKFSFFLLNKKHIIDMY